MKKNLVASITPHSIPDKTQKPVTPTTKQNIRDCCKVLESKIQIDKPNYQKHEITSKLISYNSIQLEKEVTKKSQTIMINSDISKSNQVLNELKSELTNLRMQLDAQIHDRKLSESKVNKKLSEVNEQNSLRYCELMKNHLNLQKMMLKQIDKFKKSYGQQLKMQNISLLPDQGKKQICSIKNQIDLELGELKDSFSNLVNEVKECIIQIHSKPSFSDIQNVFNEIREKIGNTTTSSEQAHTFICQLREQSDQISNKVKQMQDMIVKLNENIDDMGVQTKQITQQIIENLEDELQDKLTKIIISYNQNFSEIEQNSLQLKDMVSEILTINSLLGQKLIKFITNKLDFGTFESTIDDINAKIDQSVHINNKKINEIDQKEFQFKHQLRSLKQILETLKKDYQRNQNKMLPSQTNNNNCIQKSDVKSITNSRVLKENNYFPEYHSPKNHDILYQFVRFRKNQQKQSKRLLSSRREESVRTRRSEDYDLTGKDENKNYLADQLAELGL